MNPCQLLTTLLTLILLSFTACEQSSSNDVINKLEAFKAQEKFVEDERIYYPGIGDPALLPILTEKINLAADDFEKLAASGTATDRDYRQAIKKGLARFEPIYINLDTENRERICYYFEELMEIVGLRSSGGQLNKFMYL
jgi:Domain of unknown function (DUF4844)